MSLRDETADALMGAIKEAVGQTKDIEALRVLAESFALVAETKAGTRDQRAPGRIR